MGSAELRYVQTLNTLVLANSNMQTTRSVDGSVVVAFFRKDEFGSHGNIF